MDLLKRWALPGFRHRPLNKPLREGDEHESGGQSVYSWDHLYDNFGPAVFSAPPARLYFARHGQSDYNARGLISGTTNSSLTSYGEEQARMLAAQLTSAVDMVYSSALLRARQTMDIFLAAHHGHVMAVRFDRRLNERSLGVLEKQPRHHVPAFAEGDLDYAPEGGESYRELARRCFSFLLDLRADLEPVSQHLPRALTVLIFTHVGPMRVFEAAAGRVSGAREMMALKLDNLTHRQVEYSKLTLPNFFRG